MPVIRGMFDIDTTRALWNDGVLTKGETRLILGIDNGDENKPAEEKQ